MKASFPTTVEYSGGTYFVEWYRDDDDNSGQGANPQTTRWYGNRADCERMAKSPPPPECRWRHVQGWTPDTSPGSAAWCESYADTREG